MYTIGSIVHLTATFTDASGALVNPTTVTVAITDPAGTVTTPSAVNDSTGKYHYDYTTTLAGQFQFYFIGTGTNAAVQLPDVFTVGPITTGALISIADAKRQLSKSATVTIDDAEILAFIQAATEIVNRECGYTAPTSFTETVPAVIDGSGNRILCLTRTPVLSVQTVVPLMQGMPTIDITTLKIIPDSGVIYLANWYAWFGPQLVTYTAGRATVPAALQEACALIVQYLWETQRGGSISVPGVGGDDLYAMPGEPSFPSRALALMRMGPYYAAPGLA